MRRAVAPSKCPRSSGPDRKEEAMADVASEPLRLRMHVGGDWIDSASGAVFESVSPATGEVLAVLPEAVRADVRAAIEAASAARGSIASMPVFERATLCHAIGDALEERCEAMARELSLEQGKPYSEAVDEIMFAAELYRDAGENAKRFETPIIPSRDPAKRV